VLTVISPAKNLYVKVVMAIMFLLVIPVILLILILLVLRRHVHRFAFSYLMQIAMRGFLRVGIVFFTLVKMTQLLLLTDLV